ncbi:MAG TPA: diacylglycerol kinase family protein [Solirubrobacterales bacterium]|nr:diacylglycerol kinase family protein [Solirubrobacterales bacterium]
MHSELQGVARRAAAVGSLGLAAGAAALAVALALDRFPRGIAVFAGLVVALWAGWTALRGEGLGRLAAAALAIAAVAATILAIVLAGGLLLDLAVAAAFVASVVLARVAFRVRVDLPAGPPPRRPFLFFNPLSGDGKALRFNLAEEARGRGIRPVELRPGMDLRALVEDAVAAGADALAMAGGDGSQAIVAAIAADHGLPYACVPAGTRNHFALDLGVDREDVVGSLDALVDGGERRVDLAEVNGRVFVNNVSLGLYADAVQQSGYRDAKIRTLIAMAPEGTRPRDADAAFHWQGPDGRGGEDAVAVLVSNNPYRLGTALGSATRPHLDRGELGITTAGVDGSRHGVARLRSWTSRSFTVESEKPVAAGIDGEATTLAPPIRFASRPGALAVRIAPGHPGASPATAVPRGLPATALALARIALDKTDAPTPAPEPPVVC